MVLFVNLYKSVNLLSEVRVNVIKSVLISRNVKVALRGSFDYNLYKLGSSSFFPLLLPQPGSRHLSKSKRRGDRGFPS
jgi:hypothetical protein